MTSLRSHDFDLGPSRRLAAALVVAVVGGLVAVAFSGAPAWLVAASAAGVLPVAALEWRLQVSRRHRHAVIALGRDVAGQWWLRTRDGSAVSVELEHLWLHPAVVVLSAQGPTRRHGVVVMPDAVGAGLHRRLCAALRTHRLALDAHDTQRPWTGAAR